MAGIDVLPPALFAAARAVRYAVPDARVPAADLGHAPLTAALDAWRAAWSCEGLAADAEEAAADLEVSARTYADVETLLVPRALR